MTRTCVSRILRPWTLAILLVVASIVSSSAAVAQEPYPPAPAASSVADRTTVLPYLLKGAAALAAIGCLVTTNLLLFRALAKST